MSARSDLPSGGLLGSFGELLWAKGMLEGDVDDGADTLDHNGSSAAGVERDLSRFLLYRAGLLQGGVINEIRLHENFGRACFARMPTTLSPTRAEFPARFLTALAVAFGFVVFLTLDQVHWWQSKPDYSFGFLVPLFVLFVCYERLPKLRTLFRATGPSPLPRWVKRGVTLAAGLALACGLMFFLLGALYRAGSGVTQPGSLALAVGFSGVLIGMIYFNVPEGRVGEPPLSFGWRALGADARLRAVALFLFPALIWILSAPLVTAVENAISLFLLRKVVSVVFFVFSLLGLPLVQEGNVLVFPHGRVGVADACSGIRSLTACLFAGSFLAAVFLDKFWKKISLVAAALCLAFFTNLLRSLFLAAWAYAYGSQAIEGTLHDATGFAVLGLTTVALFMMLPLFNSRTWARWLGVGPASTPVKIKTVDTVAPQSSLVTPR